jgi:tetraacyldisaccharide 4'-kinase
MREPAFWWRPAGLAARLLAPAAAVYAAVAAWRIGRPGRAAGVAVVCIGDLTVGGAGKTPAAVAVARMLEAAGRRPFLLSRGYGGAIKGPVRVDPSRHRARDVGDEPLLLARAAPTIVARDRIAGAQAARAAGAGTIVMDDGFQNPALNKDLAIVVVDGRRGIGNGKVFPAGPLRAPLDRQLARAQAVLLIGSGPGGDEVGAAARARGLPVFRGGLAPEAQALAALKARRVLAFAGIGDPQKFFATLGEAGIDVGARVSFADHHRYRRSEAQDLIARAERDGLVLVTTEKDAARLAGQDDLKALADRARTLPVRLAVAEEHAFRDFVLASVGGPAGGYSASLG